MYKLTNITICLNNIYIIKFFRDKISEIRKLDKTLVKARIQT